MSGSEVSTYVYEQQELYPEYRNSRSKQRLYIFRICMADPDDNSSALPFGNISQGDLENLEKISTAAANLIIYIWFRCRKQKLLAHGFIGSSYTEFQNSEGVTIIGATVSFLAGKLMNKLGITSDAAYYFAKIIIGLLAYSYPHHMAVSKRLYEV